MATLGSITQAFKNQFITQFINDVRSNTNNYFITFGKNFPWPDDQNPPPVSTSVSGALYQVYTDMLFGKKMSATDIAYMARRVNWTTDTVYDIYDDTDPDLYTKNFYVVNSANRVYKCLYNNNGAPSTHEPQLFNFNGDFDTPDGYKWKYMFRISSADASKFMSADYIPVRTDNNVKFTAEPGAIHTILVTSSGSNYIAAGGAVEQVVDAFTYKVSNLDTIAIAGAYNKSSFYLVDAAGNYNDENSVIDSYVTNTAGRFVITTNPLNIPPATTLYYKIAPQVEVIGDGVDVFAVAQVNSLTNSIYGIEVISRGDSFTYATVNIVANSNFGSGATARAIISPPGGHGTDAITEIGCDVIGMSLSTSASDNLPDWITYRQVGLLYNPIASSNGTLYQDSTFTQMLEIDVNNVFDVFPEGEIVQGQTSGATGYVVYQTTTKLFLGFTAGSFVPFETLTGTYTGFTCTIDAINNRELIPNTGKLFYYRNLEPVARAGITSEQIKVYFKI